MSSATCYADAPPPRGAEYGIPATSPNFWSLWPAGSREKTDSSSTAQR